MALSTTRVVNDAGHVTDHNDIVTGLLARITTTDADAKYVSRTGNVGFYGTVPIAKAAALTAADASVVDATYGAEEAAVIANLRTRLNELESRLRAYGLLP